MSKSEVLDRSEARLGTMLRGKYRLDSVLGIGGMAVVYTATHRNQARFAIKMLHPEMSLSADVRSRFLREGYAANSIKHPGAVLVVDDDVAEDGAAFLVMELLDGVACNEVWEQSGHALSAETASAIVIQLLDVLGAAHRNGVVHRDIKPANLFLTQQGAVKVLDFGIARAREAMATGAHATSTGMTLGTPAFMAPEQALGRSREIDGRTDLWAAGATFFALVTGQSAHVAETAQEMMILAATQPARSLAAATSDLSPAIVSVIDRALAFRKEDRWDSAAAMRDALMAAQPPGVRAPESIVRSLFPRGPSAAPISGGRAPVSNQARAGETSLPATERAVWPGTPTPSHLTTSAPLSNVGAATLPPTSRRKWVIGGGIALGLSAIVGTIVLRSHPGASPASPSAARAPIHTASTVVEPVVRKPVEGASSAPAADSNLADPTRLVQVTDAASAEPVATPVSNVPTPSKRPPPSQARPPKAAKKLPTADCDPNYTLDEQGRKKFKPECFLPK